MYLQPLFHSRPTFTEKTAAPVTTRLPDDSSKWAPVVLSELHKQAPMMQDFHSNIVLDRVEVNKGFGFGYIIAKPKSSNPLLATKMPFIRIPVVIRNWKLAPFDIFFDQSGKGYPITERRIQDSLMRTDAFDGPASDSDGGSNDMRTMLTPPWENVGQFYRGVNTAVSQGSQVKTSSLLNALDGTVDEKSILQLEKWVNSDEGIRSLYDRDIQGAFLDALNLSPGFQGDYVKTAESSGPTVIQYRWDGGRNMTVKIAQPDGFAPQQGQVDAQQAAQGMDPNQQAQVAQEGAAVQAPPAEIISPEQLESDEYMPVSQFGVYKVLTVNNEQLVGWVFPYILSFKMEKVNMAIFTDGTNYATHASIPGVPIGNSVSLPNEQPQGRGVFYVIRGGRAFCFAPVELMGEQTQPDGSTMYMAQTIIGGNQIQLMKVQGLRASAEMGESIFGIPEDVKWLGFKHQTNPLVEDPTQATQRGATYVMARAAQLQQQQMAQQQAAAQQQQGGKKGGGQTKTSSLIATIRATQDGTYTLSGEPFEKIAYEYTHFLDEHDTAWMLALAGIAPEYTMDKLASIHTYGGYLQFPVLRQLTPPKQFHVKTAALTELTSKYKRFMAKHAAALEDPMIADTLLSLNFLTPRNVTTFIDYLDQLEDTVNAVSNLLLASRVGMKEIPEIACSETLRNLEDVINGLKMVAMKRGKL